MRTSGEAIPSSVDLWQQGIDLLAAAELVFRTGPREILDAATLSGVFAVGLLIRSLLEDRNPGDPNMSVAELFGRLKPAEQRAIIAHSDLERAMEAPPLARVKAERRTWLEWHEFMEGPKGNRDRADFFINLGRGIERYKLADDETWGGRNRYRNSGSLARSLPLLAENEQNPAERYLPAGEEETPEASKRTS